MKLAVPILKMGEVEKYGTGFIRIRDCLKEYPELTYQLKDSGGVTRLEISITGIAENKEHYLSMAKANNPYGTRKPVIASLKRSTKPYN